MVRPSPSCFWFLKNAAQINNRDLLIFLGSEMLADVVFNFIALRLAFGQGGSIFAFAVLTAVANLGVLVAAIAIGWLIARGLKKLQVSPEYS